MSTQRLVYIVDDDCSFRTSMARMLSAAGLGVRSFASAKEFLAGLGGEPDDMVARCVLSDLCMPGLDGLQLQEACEAAGIGLPFVILTGHGNVPTAVTAMRHGAIDFLDKCAPQPALLCSLNRALESDARSRAVRAQHEDLAKRFATLTVREREVLEHVVHGRMNKQIAATLGIHERTVKLHRKSITTKVGVRSAAELTTLSAQIGLFQSQN